VQGRLVEWRAELLPVGDELVERARLEDSTREDVVSCRRSARGQNSGTAERAADDTDPASDEPECL
jgi:hypothetical protein